MLDLAHRPDLLFAASIEQKEAAWAAFERRDYVLAVYLAGLAVECILQAVALTINPEHDARHDLTKWLARCPSNLRSAMKSNVLREHWNLVVRFWRNDIRYFARSGLLGYLRTFTDIRGIRGGPDAIMRVMAKRIIEAASAVHYRGVVVWTRSRRR